MSRARNIKPGFFKNDVLAECDPLARILFAGLWCEADRDGRLEDRPKRLKGEYLAYDNCDADVLLQQLNDRGFIKRYSCNGTKYIQVLEFKKHQNPHVKEAASTIPEPDEHGSSTVQTVLIPDSPSLIPDSPIQKKTDPDGSAVAGKPAPPPCPHDKIIDLYHEHLPMLRRVRDWTPARQEQLRARWQEKPARQSLDWWKRLFEFIGISDFLTGRAPARQGERPFKCDLEWIVKRSNLVKILERKYHPDSEGVAA